MIAVDGQQLKGIAETIDVDVKGAVEGTGEGVDGVGIEGEVLIVPKEGVCVVVVFSLFCARNARPVEITRRNLGCLHSSRWKLLLRTQMVANLTSGAS